MTGAARASQLKKVTEAENSEVSTSLAAKAKDNAKTGGYGLVIIGGLGLIAVVAGTILKAWHGLFKISDECFYADFL